ncbi:MAG: colanic acid biosynthesis acetyltransferase WcaF, partial [Planctomycetota bacterium]
MAEPPMQRLDRCTPRPYARGEYMGRMGWKMVESTVVRWSPRRAAGWRRWWLRRFGADARGAVQPGVRVWHPWLLELGAWSMLADGVEVYNLGRVRIGSHTVVSQRAFLCAGTHDHQRSDLPLVRSEIVIGDGVWVAAEAFIGPGVTVGDGA